MLKNILFIWPLPGQENITKGFTYKLVNDEPKPTSIHTDGITEDILDRKLKRAVYVISEDGSVEFIRNFDDQEYDDMFKIWDDEVGPGSDLDIDGLLEDYDV